MQDKFIIRIMKQIFRIVFFSILGAVLLVTNVYSKQDRFPFVGEVTADKVNVRAGESTNFERLCQLRRGDEVIAVGRHFSWYKIRLPGAARCFVNAKYIRPIGNGAAEVVADRVNVRASGSINSSILVQLSRGDKVRIIADTDGWYQISPPDNSYGWVSDKFISFKSRKISKPKPTLEPVVDDNSVEPIKEQKKIISAPKSVQGDTFSATGYIDVLPYPEKKGILYQLLIDKKPAYYLDGPDYIFSDFLHLKVKVEGSYNKSDSDGTSLPVVKVSRIELVL